MEGDTESSQIIAEPVISRHENTAFDLLFLKALDCLEEYLFGAASSG